MTAVGGRGDLDRIIDEAVEALSARPTVETLAVGATYRLLSAEVVYTGPVPQVRSLTDRLPLHSFEAEGGRLEMVSEPFLAELCASGMLTPVVGR